MSNKKINKGTKQFKEIRFEYMRNEDSFDISQINDNHFHIDMNFIYEILSQILDILEDLSINYMILSQ